jgi:hypothetical protein
LAGCRDDAVSVGERYELGGRLPYERADITTNTYWDWYLTQVGLNYGLMDEVFQFVATFDEHPPR